MNNSHIIFIVFVIVMFIVSGIRSIIAESKANKSEQRGERGDADQQFEHRRSEPADQPQTMVGGFEGRDASQMSMAERIELARQRAREQSGAVSRRSGEMEDALERTRVQAEQEAERRRQAAQAQQRAAREQAEQRRRALERERVAADRREAAERRAQTEREARRHSRQRQNRPRQSQTKPKPQLATPASVPIIGQQSARRGDSLQRVNQDRSSSDPLATIARKRGVGKGLGKIDRAALRKAIIMKELLDKPVALRGEQDGLLS